MLTLLRKPPAPIHPMGPECRLNAVWRGWVEDRLVMPRGGQLALLFPVAGEARLLAWKERGDEWEERLTADQLRLVALTDDVAGRTEAAQAEWRSKLVAFDQYARGAVRIGEIDAKIVVLDKQLKLDRTALERWKNQLPGFYDDIEGMAKSAEAARKENAENAVGLGFSLAVDATVMNNLAKETVTRAQIKAVKDVLMRDGIRPEHVKQLLSSWEGPGSVKSMRSARQMIETLSQLMDLAGAVDTADKHKYWQALAAALSIFVQHPVLKLIKTNVEVYANLLHTGLAYATARARVNQFSKLSDEQLKSVNRLSELMVKRIRERNKLRQEKEQVRVQLGFS